MSSTAEAQPRATCARCRRPLPYCYCARLPNLTSTTDVLFLQHPKERDKAIGTARIAHLSLPSSTLVEGIALDEHRAVAPLLERDDVALLFPGPGARLAHEWAADPPSTLVVIDGTWWQAKRVLERSPRLAALPRVSLAPSAPSNYRIRKAPSDLHLSTVEAVATTLGILEGAPEKFAEMLAPFELMVERQLKSQLRRQSRVRKRTKRLHPALDELAPLVSAPERAVVVYAEANAHSRDNRAPGAPELVQLVACRPHSEERFEAILQPRRRLGAFVPERLGLEPRLLHEGESVESFVSRWRSFLGRNPQLCAWGPFPRDLLEREEDARRGFIDLRALTARCLGRAAGGIERGAADLCGAPAAAQPRRADRMLSQLLVIYRELVVRGHRSVAEQRPRRA
jgi:DTW domain-containing protein YfiP